MYNSPLATGYRRIGSPPAPDSNNWNGGSFRSGGSVSKSEAGKKIGMMVNGLPWRTIAMFFMALSLYLSARLSYTMGHAHGQESLVRMSPDGQQYAAPPATSYQPPVQPPMQPAAPAPPAQPIVPQVPQMPPTDTSSGLSPSFVSQPNAMNDLKKFAVYPAQTDVNMALAHPLAKRIIVSEKSRIMYCPIPKAANSNWKFLIRKFEGFEDYKDLNVANNRALSGLKYLENFSATQVVDLINDPNMLKFTFARDPYVRTLSCYLNKFADKDTAGEEYKNYMAQLYGWSWVNQHDITTEPRPTFAEFLSQVATQSFEDMNEHWAPQAWMCGIGIFPFDFVGKLEEVETYAPKVIEWMADGAESHFPTQDEIRFSSHSTSDLVDQYYTPELKQRVREIFADDFRLLGYQP